MSNVSHLRFLARYCNPITVRGGMPKENAFWIRPACRVEQAAHVAAGPRAANRVACGLLKKLEVLLLVKLVRRHELFAVFGPGPVLYGGHRTVHRPSFPLRVQLTSAQQLRSPSIRPTNSA